MAQVAPVPAARSEPSGPHAVGTLLERVTNGVWLRFLALHLCWNLHEASVPHALWDLLVHASMVVL